MNVLSDVGGEIKSGAEALVGGVKKLVGLGEKAVDDFATFAEGPEAAAIIKFANYVSMLATNPLTVTVLTADGVPAAEINAAIDAGLNFAKLVNTYIPLGAKVAGQIQAAVKGGTSTAGAGAGTVAVAGTPPAGS